MLIKSESSQRISRLQDELKKLDLHAALIILPIDIFYYAGTRQNSILWVPASGEPLLLVRKSLTRANEEAVVEDIRPFPSSKEFPSLIPETAVKIGITFDAVPIQQQSFYARLLPGREFVDISAANREIRSVKSSWELERMAESGVNLGRVFRQVPEFLKPGMRELDLAAEFEYRLRKAGNEGFVRMRAFNQELFLGLAVSAGSATRPGFFDGAVTGRGLSSAFPHGASMDLLESDVPILVDYTGVFNGYIVDMTRIFVCGKLSEELTRAFGVSLEIQQYVAEHLKPGVICEELFLKSAEMADNAGLQKYYMGAPGENARFVGHGVGLELDEFPVLAQGFKVPLQEGQTIAVEPKFVIPGQGVIGIENTFAVSSDGGVKLTDIPDDIVYI